MENNCTIRLRDRIHVLGKRPILRTFLIYAKMLTTVRGYQLIHAQTMARPWSHANYNRGIFAQDAHVKDQVVLSILA